VKKRCRINKEKFKLELYQLGLEVYVAGLDMGNKQAN
jgi:hypothetical protein